MAFRALIQTSRFFSSSAREKKSEFTKVGNLVYKIRSIRSEDIPQVVEIARQNLFQYTIPSLQFWAQHDADGIQVAETETGNVIGACGTVKNHDSLYFGGMFTVQENCRNSYVGRELIDACYDHAGGRNIAVNCAIRKIPTFKRKGISIFETEFKSLEYETYKPVNPDVLSDKLPVGVEIVPFQNSYLQAILEYDQSFMGYERKSIIEANCKEETSKTLVAFKDGTCVGFGSIKLTIMGIGRVGPLYADDPAIGEAMLKRLIKEMPEVEGFTIVTISSNLYANMLLEALGLPVHDNIYRLYSCEKLKVDTRKLFAHFDIDFTPF